VADADVLTGPLLAESVDDVLLASTVLL